MFIGLKTKPKMKRMSIRKLTKYDYHSFLILINQFRPTEFCEKQFYEVLDSIERSGEVWVIEKDDELIGCGTIFYERKFIYNICTMAHIEDVCVRFDHRGNGYGKLLIKHLLQESKKHKCYKVTLDCNDSNVEFYKKCGLTKRGNQMAELIENL